MEMEKENNYDTKQTFDDEFTIPVQKKFLSVMIHDPQWTMINGLEVIKPEYFDNHYLQNICKWIIKYCKKYKSIPTKLVLKQKAQNLVNDKSLSPKEYYQYQELIEEIFNVSESDDYEFFKQKAVTFAQTATWKAALYDATNCLKIHNYEEAISKFKEVLSIGMEKDLGIDFSKQTTDELIQLISETYDKANMVKTGIDGWDKALGGGFTRNNLHIVAAPPGGGKSRIMAFLAKQALMAGKKVVFITLELTEAETAANLNTAVTGFTIYDLLKPENRDEFNKKRTAFKNTFGDDLFIKFYRPGTVNTDTLHNYIRKIMSERKEELGGIEWKPDFIIVDYMDKLLPIQKLVGRSYEDMGAVANDLKNLAISFDCPVLSGSQLGKYSWNTKDDDVVSMDSISESAQKIHLAHSMTTINSNPGEKALNRARLFLAKSRSGIANSIVWVENNLGKCSVREIEQWDPSTVNSDVGYKIKSSSTQK